jgi:hypothetical protein
MTNTTYVAVAPDGSRQTRTTHRTYTHAVLAEGADGWGAVGFCGRLDLAEKKQVEHPGSLVVEAFPSTGETFGAEPADETRDEVAENTTAAAQPSDDAPGQEQTVDEKIASAKVHGPEPKRTIGSLVQELLMDRTLDYLTIVNRVKAEFPDAKTSVRSVASVAAVLRRNGAGVPHRRKLKR